MIRTWFLILVAGLPFAKVARGADPPAFDRKTDVVYGRKYGMALTMDVFTPKDNPNGAAIVWIVSGGWFSAHEAINPAAIEEFLKTGIHCLRGRSRQPAPVHDSGNHQGHEPGGAVHPVSRQGLSYRPRPNRDHGRLGGRASVAHAGNRRRPGRQERQETRSTRPRAASRRSGASSRRPISSITARPGENAVGRGILSGFKPPFDFQEQDPTTKVFRSITDEDQILEIGRQISPVYHVSADDPPTLIIHGDADKLVPIQQAELILEKLKAAGVETKLVVKTGVPTAGPTCSRTMRSSPTGSMRI